MSATWAVAAEEAAAPTLVARLGSPSTEERVEAIRALAELGDPAAAPDLAHALEADPSPEARGWAARALVAVARDDAAPALARAAEEDPDPRVQSLCRRLAGLPEPAAGAPAQAAPAAPPAAADLAASEGPARLGAPSTTPPEIARSPRRGRSLLFGGAITLGLSYGFAFLGGLLVGASEEPAALYMMIPVAGPVLMAYLGNDDGDEVRAVLWVWAAVEVVGAALTLAGYLVGLLADRPPPPRPRRAPIVEILPAGPAGSAGLSAVGRFF